MTDAHKAVITRTLMFVGVALTVLTMLAWSRSADGDTVTLRRAVRLPVGTTDVTLGDIAELEGVEAHQFGTLVVGRIEATTDVLRIRIGDVRAVLDDAGVHWGRLHLNGREVTVRPTRDAGGMPLAMQAVEIDAPLEPAPQQSTTTSSEAKGTDASTIIDAPTVCGEVARIIINGLRQHPKDVKLRFDAADDAFLDIRAQGVQIEIEPLTSFRSDVIQLIVRLWRDGAVAESRSLTVHPLLRTSIATTTRDMQRHEVISDGDLDTAEHWLKPSESRLVAQTDVAVGRVTDRRLARGERLMERHIRRQAIVKRGDVIRVRCLVGGTAISLDAIARSDGAEGEIIPCLRQGERTPFNARITGPGEAVVDLSRAQARGQDIQRSRS